jgi:hypothetical protein
MAAQGAVLCRSISFSCAGAAWLTWGPESKGTVKYMRANRSQWSYSCVCRSECVDFECVP